MTDAQGREEGICAGPGLSHEPPWRGGSTHAVTNTHRYICGHTENGQG